MVTTIRRPFHESIIDAVDALKMERPVDLEVLDVLALVVVTTAVPRNHRISVGAAFARKAKLIVKGPKFRRAETVLANIERVIASLAEQDDSE